MFFYQEAKFSGDTLQEMPYYYSPSQVSTYRDCPRKWFYSRTLNRPRKDTPATLKGKKIHSQLEGWLKNKVPPENDRAKLLIPLLPLPHESLLIEHEIRLLTPPGLLRGYVDVLAPTPTLDWPADLPRLPTVFDHKTTIDLWNAKSPAALENDPQALLYGLGLRVLLKERGEDPEQDIQCVWNYTSTGSERGTSSVRVRQTYAAAEGPLSVIFGEVKQMRGFLEPTPVAPESVPVHLTGCKKYGGCEFADVCPAVQHGSGRSVLEDLATEPELVHLTTNATRKQENTGMASTTELLAKLKELQSKNLVAKRPGATTDVVVDTTAQVVTPEPALSSPDVSAVPDEPSGNVSVVPPDAPAPKKRAKKSEVEATAAPASRSARADRFLDLFERFVVMLEEQNKENSK